MAAMARDMFGQRENRRARPSTSDSSGGAASAKRPEGVSRELFMLTGGVTPTSLMPAPALGLQSKPVARRRWERVKFIRTPTEKSLHLRHWAPVGQPHDAYAFARFNKSVRMLTYTDEEWNAVIADLLPLNMDESVSVPPRKRSGSQVKSNKSSGLATKASQRIEKLSRVKKEAVPAEGATDAASPKTPTTNTSSPPAVSKAVKEISLIVPIVKGPSHAPPSSVAAGTRKSIIASPKALALAAEAANIALPENSKPPRTTRVSKPPRASRSQKANESEGSTAPDDASAKPSGNTQDSIYYVKPQKPWTRQETDELFDLCARFDLRFTVVHDRWPDTLEPRSVDELKDRYYSVAKALIEYKTRTNKDALSNLPLALQKHCQAITMNPFDYEYESIRKNQQEWQYRRSKKELREEEETVREARRIEANRKRLTKEKQRLAKLLTPHGDIRAGTAAGDAAAGGQKTFPHRKVQTGAFARSSMIYTPVSNSSRISKRIDGALRDLEVGTRPTPTAIVVDNFDLLRIDIMAYIELQRTVMRKEEDVYGLRVKLAKLKGESPPPAPPGVTLSHKKRKIDDMEGSLFGPPLKKKQTEKEQPEKETNL